MSVKLPPLLVVDDEKNMRLSLEAVMADEGYEVRAVDSAEQALRLLEQEDFFMIITDARLNGMSGYEFLGRSAAHLFHDFEDVRTEHDRLSLFAQSPNECLQDPRGAHIQAGKRLIQHDDARVVEHRRRDENFLPHTFRIR